MVKKASFVKESYLSHIKEYKDKNGTETGD